MLKTESITLLNQNKIITSNKVCSIKYLSIELNVQLNSSEILIVEKIIENFNAYCIALKINSRLVNLSNFLVLKKNQKIYLFVSFIDKNPTMRTLTLKRVVESYFQNNFYNIVVQSLKKEEFLFLIVSHLLANFILVTKLSTVNFQENLLHNERN